MIIQIDWDVEAEGCDSGAGVSSASPIAGATHVISVISKRSARIVAEVKRQGCDSISVIPARRPSCKAMNVFESFCLGRAFSEALQPRNADQRPRFRRDGPEKLRGRHKGCLNW